MKSAINTTHPFPNFRGVLCFIYTLANLSLGRRDELEGRPVTGTVGSHLPAIFRVRGAVRGRREERFTQHPIGSVQERITNILVRRITIDRRRKLHFEISIDLLNLFTDDDHERFKGQDQRQIKTAGIHPGWRDDS